MKSGYWVAKARGSSAPISVNPYGSIPLERQPRPVKESHVAIVCFVGFCCGLVGCWFAFFETQLDSSHLDSSC